MTSTSKVPCAILGATGTVGQKFILLLAAHPVFEVKALGASDRSAGKKYSEACSWKQEASCPSDIWSMEVRSITNAVETFADVEVIFSALPSDSAEACELPLARSGKKVFSNAGANRMGSDIPILLPLVNGNHVDLVKEQEAYKTNKGFIVTNSNCATVGIATTLRVLEKVAPISKVMACTLQAISGAGYPGVASLDILGNVVPYIGNEEEKIEEEANKILGTVCEDVNTVQFHPLKVSSMVHRVPVIDGHIVSLSVEFDHSNYNKSQEALVEECIKALSAYTNPDEILKSCYSAPPANMTVVYREEPNRPQPRLDAWTGKGFSTVVGNVRPCNLFDVKMATLAHNTVIGAAGGSVLNAEYAFAKGLIR